jgi:nucleoside-diphosphate-sugar epimerase
MQDKKVLVIGCGKIGGRVAQALSNDFQVTGLRRTPQAQQDSIHYIFADVCNQAELQISFEQHLSDGVDYLVYCLTPSKRDEQSYRASYVDGLTNVLSTLPNKQKLKRLFFISSSSVYHQNDDSWIDENSPREPTSFSGKIILEAEELLQRSQVASTIIRFSGIYGGTRRQLINQIIQSVRTNTPILSDSLRRTNRIHEDDCVGFIEFLIRKVDNGDDIENLYLASDNEPVDLNEVILWLAKALDINISQEKTEHSKRRSGNKKCSNKRMLESGYVLKFSGFREGYRDMLE